MDLDKLKFDERGLIPAIVVDAENKKAVIAFIREKTKNKTVLWVTHDKAEAETADAILYL